MTLFNKSQRMIHHTKLFSIATAEKKVIIHALSCRTIKVKAIFYFFLMVQPKI